MGSKQSLTQDQIEMIAFLRKTIESVTGRSVITRIRKRELVQAKMIFSLILNQNGISKKEIGRIHGMDHSSIHHHINTIKNLIKQDESIRDFYLYIKDSFDSKKVNIPLHVNQYELPVAVMDYIGGITLEKELLKLEAIELRKIKSDRFFSILKLLEENVEPGMELIAERKIKKALNV